ncbi:MAG: adenylosuccinate lyase [Bacteroidota bacterium]|nr:adenylosuccinate lyase [Bacteroidota bacterium]
MELNTFTAISPIDGRYRKSVESLANYFSEGALIRYRVMVEVEYFIALCELPLPQLKKIDKKIYDELRNIFVNISSEDIEQVKEIEKTTNHDVKAVEYFIKSKFDEIGLQQYKEFIHLGLTSQDINNTAVPCSLRDAFNEVYLPLINELIQLLNEYSLEWKDVTMLARTHGQPASPTKLGKEIYVFVERLQKQMSLLLGIPFSAKFGGATGNFNAHHIAYPKIDWVGFANDFVNNKLMLDRSQTTTQIEHYDNFAAFCDNISRINTIMLDLDRDMWTYISMDYFKQKIKQGEVGSSAMPHKVNPIDFENSEGNLGIANAVFRHFSQKLPVSRLQRDLTDSTVLRNVGVPIAHSIIGIKSLLRGLGKIILNQEKINHDLDSNWAVVAEAIQTILRTINYPNPYEALKELTRTNKHITRESIAEFIDNLQLDNKTKEKLKTITPFNYTGVDFNLS